MGIAAGLTLLMLLSACNSVDPVVKIGLVGPFEGRYRAVGYDVIYSARLAVREVNLRGGVGGYRVNLVALDDFGEPESAVGSAAALVEDPAVVAAIGHWLPETTAAAESVYSEGGLAFVPTEGKAFAPISPEELPQRFLRRYAEVTPFDETAGPLAAPAYDAIRFVLAAMALAADTGEVSRSTIFALIGETVHEGITGREISLP